MQVKCGVEVHQQLEGKKLFCSCPTLIQDGKGSFTIQRKLRAAAGEGGKVDIAAAQEQQADKTMIYHGYESTCLVEVDEEPPHAINTEALYSTLQFCKMVGATVSPIIQVMRKTVVDGSNTSGFQRTALVARGGVIETSAGPVRIDNINVEEDSCKIISQKGQEKNYSLDRLGIPLIEVGTKPDITSGEQAQEAARALGMLLRSLPGVKRGLGTIRQDVNVSIPGGARIEIKGAQDLKLIPTYVQYEAQRQTQLLKIKDELRHVRLNDFEVFDVSMLLGNVESKIVRSTLDKGGKVMGIKLHGFAGMIGRELQPGYRLGTEFAGRAKVRAGVGGIFHSDELPNYGIEEKHIVKIRQKLKCTPQDGFVLVATSEGKCRLALQAVYERARELWGGIPKEVRRAKDDGTTVFMRPMPGAARMYPETDVALIRGSLDGVEVPELITDKIARLEKDYRLTSDLASFVVKSGRGDLFEKIVKESGQKPGFVAETLSSTPLEIKRKHSLDVENLRDGDFESVFRYLKEGKINKDNVMDVLIDMITGSLDLKKYESLGDDEVEKVVQKVVDENKGAPFGALMGKAMAALGGKASGKAISAALKRILG